LSAPEEDTQATWITGLAGRAARHPVAAGVASGFFLWTSFPPVEWSWLAWIALAPLFWLGTWRGARFMVCLAGWVGGRVFWVLAVEGIRLTDESAWLGWLVLALTFSFWWPAFLALTRWAVFRLQVPLMLAAPIIWVALEYTRAYFLSGFPWYYL